MITSEDFTVSVDIKLQKLRNMCKEPKSIIEQNRNSFAQAQSYSQNSSAITEVDITFI